MPNSKTLLLLGFIASLLVNILLLNKVVTKEYSSSFSLNSGDIHFAFSDVVDDPKTLLLQAIDEANYTLDIAIYNFEDKEIAQAVLNANNRGVNVRIITDASKAKKENQAAILDEFSQNNIDVKINTLRKMHLKMAIIDERLIVTGSYNFTEASANENLEQLITVANEELAQEWTGIFSDVWSRSEFKEWTLLSKQETED
ncbi:phospholipase D-like domain-containing protein [Bacillus sp. FJAT-50079]|uniref:phospholipase D-like domain-containing protein n=1 Tax=Bacillus sp. FJAT-50079 TaxID=2833577 RepID=UPI001BC983CF|nr:phospholipase D-like domain-containing protein [Bacillus sp. FJAT-50079]MBS4209524.1 hypothetical protein [Bacillus sp. FJAT-50079]